jgi:endonuclease/exonuclease/phosphatase family metal-dependent hydrolase
MHVIRVATQNIWGYHGDWPARRPVLRDGLGRFDLVALQEAFGDEGPTLAVAGSERLFDRPVGGVWASDHFGVAAELALPPWS